MIAIVFLAISNYSYSANEYRLSGTGAPTFYSSLQAVLTAANSVTNGTAAKTITVVAAPPAEAAGSTLTGANYTTLLFTSSGVFTITSTGGAAILILDGADNVTIDGTAGGGTLTFNNTSVALAAGSIQMVNGSSNNIVRNCTCIGVGVATSQGGRTINIGQSLLDAQGGNNNNIIERNTVIGGRRGIQVFGSAPLGGQLGVTNDNTIIRNNVVKNNSSIGIFVGSETRNNTVLSNEVFMDPGVVVVGDGLNFRGINCQGVGTNNIRKNRVHDLSSTTPSSTFFGILSIPVTLTAPGSNLTTNNIINNCVTLMTNNDGQVIGIDLSNIAQEYTGNVFNNTCRLAGNSTVQQFSAALIADNNLTGSIINLCNNIAINGKTSAVDSSTQVGLDLTTYPATGVTLNSDYNIGKGLDTITGWDAGYNGFLYRNAGGLALYKAAAFPNEQHTAFMNVLFTGLNTCDLNLAAVGGDMSGKPLALVPDDINGTVRNATYPYRGAYEGPALKVLSVTVCLEGKVAGGEIQVCLYDANCNLISDGTADINFATGKTNLAFGNAVSNGVGYYLRVKSINHLATWSALPNIVFAAGGPPNATYDFTTSPSKAFGNNQTPGPPSCMFGGDVNQDGTIDVTDAGLIDNDAFNFTAGPRLATDINSDGVVDLSDASIADNNIFNFVSKVSPCPVFESIISGQIETKQLQVLDKSNTVSIKAQQ